MRSSHTLLLCRIIVSVTAGVLRGDNARFQLFGDTMNTAARVESFGLRNRIHMSQECADLVIAAGKTKWLSKREDVINAKGKGELQTYWLNFAGDGTASSTHSSTPSDDAGAAANIEANDNEDGGMDESEKMAILNKSVQAAKLPVKIQRLVEWNSSVLLDKLKDVVLQRNAGLPDKQKMEVSPEVIDQINQYVEGVARRYHDNPFHNFEHASHVTLSVVKLLSRVVEDDSDTTNYTRGIASNAMMQFGVIFSALIHDVDHLGVPNAQLVEENHDLASKYDHSIAENNSIAVAWELLMNPAFEAFRTCIAPNEAYLKAFHETIINATLATDIVDKDLKADRNQRWADAFSESAGEKADVKVRIVLEHLIQASDICHTMQHWHVYRKWNERMFEEMYRAFREGRAARDPSEFWCKGEIGFFDFVSTLREFGLCLFIEFCRDMELRRTRVVLAGVGTKKLE